LNVPITVLVLPTELVVGWVLRRTFENTEWSGQK